MARKPIRVRKNKSNGIWNFLIMLGLVVIGIVYFQPNIAQRLWEPISAKIPSLSLSTDVYDPENPPIHYPKVNYPDGCNGPVSMFIYDWPGSFSVPKGGESEIIHLGNFNGIIVICDINGQVSYKSVGIINPPGIEWAFLPSVPLTCTDGPLQQGKWYGLWSTKGYIPFHRYDDHPEFIRAYQDAPAWYRYEGMEGDRYLFQGEGGPSIRHEMLPMSNPGGIVGCALADQSWEYWTTGGGSPEDDY